MYYIVFGILYIISLLPLRVLYLLSDLAYFIIYHLMGYRKDVVMNNLNIAFPNKTEEEKTIIAKKFYRNFTDTFIETIKFISASPAFFKKHFQADYSIVDEVYKLGRPVQVHVGHNFNWELVNLGAVRMLPQPVLGVYLPLKNKIFDRFFRYLRARRGTILIAATRMREEMLPWRGKQYVLGLIADQSPPGPDKAYWVNFFGRPTAFLKAPEDAARRNNLPILFGHFTKVKRGHYIGHMELCTTEPSSFAPGQITSLYAQYLQRVMSEQPEMWLWSHRRWKLEWKEEYGMIN